MLDSIKNAGVVGGGGAGFPTWKKLDTNAEHIILNAAECEPFLETDKYYLRHYTQDVLKGLLLAAKQVAAINVIIVIKESYLKEIEILESEISKGNFPIKLKKVPSIYPAGDEQVAVFEATNRVVPPGNIPSSVGAVVISVTTAANIFCAVENNKAVTKRLITVYGDVVNPIILDVPVGISVLDCIEAAGGTTTEKYRIIMGGPMMGKLLPQEGQLDAVIKKADSGIFVIPENHILVKNNDIDWEHVRKKARVACIQCQYCTELCPRFLLGHKLYPHKIMRAVALGEDLEAARSASLCCECGVCELYACPMDLNPRRVNMSLKQKLREAEIKPDTQLVEENLEIRSYRQIPTDRLSNRIAVSKYFLDASDRVKELLPDTVKIPMHQHIGAPSVPCVSVGESVSAGTIIGKVNEGSLGAPVHSSISGLVREVSEKEIVIEGGGVK